jgi:hypothetical protein
MTAALLAAPQLTVGDRCEVTPEARRIIRPRSKHTGAIVGDGGSYWRVLFDGTTTPRQIVKAYMQGRELRR